MKVNIDQHIFFICYHNSPSVYGPRDSQTFYSSDAPSLAPRFIRAFPRKHGVALERLEPPLKASPADTFTGDQGCHIKLIDAYPVHDDR